MASLYMRGALQLLLDARNQPWRFSADVNRKKAQIIANNSCNAFTIYIEDTYRVLESFKPPILSVKIHSFYLITMDTLAQRNEDCLTFTTRVAYPY